MGLLKSTFCCTRRISCSFYCTFTILLWSPRQPRPYINFPFSIRTQCWIDSGSWEHGGIFATRNRNHGNNGMAHRNSTMIPESLHSCIAKTTTCKAEMQIFTKSINFCSCYIILYIFFYKYKYIYIYSLSGSRLM